MPARSDRRTKVAQRRLQVEQLHKGGGTQQQIAATLGVSIGTVNADLQKIDAAWRETYAEDRDVAKRLDLARLDDMLVSLTNAVRSGDLAAQRVYLGVLERRAAIWGYDAPARVDQRVHGHLQAGPPIAELWRNAEKILAKGDWTPRSHEPSGNDGSKGLVGHAEPVKSPQETRPPAGR